MAPTDQLPRRQPVRATAAARLVALAAALLALTHGCATRPLKPEAGTRPDYNGIVVFRSGNERFRLKGSHGLVMQWKSGQLQCQLFGRDGSTVSTVHVPKFLLALDQLPAGTVVDFYDTCTVSLCQNSTSAQEVLRHCRDRGIAGATYIMCTDVGITRRAGPWPLPRTNSPPDLRPTPTPTPAPPVAR